MLDVTPETDTNPTGTTHTLTATLINANTEQTGGNANTPGTGCTSARQTATEVDFEVVSATGSPATYAPASIDDDDTPAAPDMTCTIPANQQGTGGSQANSCQVQYTRNEDGQDVIFAFVDENASNTNNEDEIEGDPGTGPDDPFGGATPREAQIAANDNDANDTVTKNWTGAQNQIIDCGPEGDVNPTGTQHTVTCEARSATGGGGVTLEGVDIDYQVTGANPTGPQHGCTTGANGTCSFTYTGNNAGGDVIQAFVNQDGNHTNNDCGAEATGDTEDDDFCDQVEKTWQARTATFLDVEPETDTNPNGTTHTLTATFTDQFGDPIELSEGQLVDFEIISGPNANLTPNFRDFECPSNNPTQNGTCSATYTDNQNFDANNATDTICAWISTDGDDDQFDFNGTPADGGDCDAETPNETEQGVDPNNQNIAGNEGNDQTDTVLKTWTAPAQQPATQVNAEPETDTNPVGTQHTIGVFAGSANNQPTTATNIRADILPGSPNASQQTGQAEINCVQDNTPGPGITFPQGESQTHECTYTGANTGTDTLRVFADSNGNNIFDQGEPFDQVTKTWAGPAFALQLTPDQDTATAGTCNEFTVRVTDQQGNPVVGQIVDVEQVLQGAGTEPNETRELAFCNPPNAQGPNPTGVGGTAFGDVQGNNQGQTAGQAGRNTTVHAEVGPTNNQGEVTFGITINNVPTGQTATVSVRAWVDTQGDNDTFNAGEPTDQPSTKTWTAGGTDSVTALNAEPETATNPNGTQHQVTVTLTPAVQGVTPNSIIANNAAGRPAGDVADANAGTSPNAAGNQGNFNVYNCTPSNAQGVSTCTFNDPIGTAAGTDTIVFYVNQSGGGTAGPDAGEPQDAVQKTWTAGPQNLIIDLQCAGTGTNDDQDIAEQGIDNPGTPDCTNPLSDQDEVFTAIITNANNIGQQNIRVDFSFGQRTNGNAAGANNSTNDATLNATPGGQVGTAPPGLQTFCLTDATGRCSVTLTNPTPQAGDTIEVIGVISGQTVGGPAQDGATKQWQTGVVNQGGTITLTPRAATNQVGTQHTVTATVRNQFGQPVQGANVDFRIVSGPNAGLAQAGMTDAVTDANGNATFTYTSQAVGTDEIRACSETGGTENDTCNPNQGEPEATAFKTWQTGPVTTNAVALDMDADDNQAVNATGTPGQCELTTGGADPARESSATNQINPNPGGQLAAQNFHRICAAAFQNNQQANNGRLAGAQITFTIQGPGRISAANANGQCPTNAVPAAGTTLTVTADNDGFAFACLYSQQVGRTTVTASSGNPAQTATGTKDWTVSPTTARFIQLCHGDVAGTTCDTAQSTNEPNDEHEMTARVTDAQGNPVANVPVQFRETGPGIFIPQGGSTATVLTDANGLAAVLLTSDVEGTSTIVAEIDPGNTTARTAGPNNDECEAPAGTNNQPPAGNCVSQTLTKVWDTEPEEFQCDDGIDNDNDGNIDFPEDQGCESDTDNSEFPVDPPVVEEFRHDRSISIRFNDGTGARNNGLVVFGRLRAPDYPDCRAAQPVNIQRRVSGRWVTKKTTTTNRRGRYAVEIFDLASRYRAVAPRTEILEEDVTPNELHICRKAVKAKRHRHRR